MSKVYTTEEQVMFYDTDIGGVVHNLAYLRMIEACRTHLGALAGFDFKLMSETQVFPVVVRTEIDYKRPATLGDVLVISGKLAEYSRSSFWCEFEVKNKETDILYINCRQKLAVVQMPAGRPMRLPKETIAVFEDGLT